jgi:hypothetical protein
MDRKTYGRDANALCTKPLQWVIITPAPFMGKRLGNFVPGQLRALAALPPVPIGQKIECTPEPIWTT